MVGKFPFLETLLLHVRACEWRTVKERSWRVKKKRLGKPMTAALQALRIPAASDQSANETTLPQADLFLRP